MSQGIQSLIESGTRLWLDSVDPALVQKNRDWGVTGATSNPVIVADLISTGRFDSEIAALLESGLSDDEIAWDLTDRLVSHAQKVFAPVWEQTGGDDGYVSFELDPLIDADSSEYSQAERTGQYIELAARWSAGHTNRMIKVPATPAGIAALGEIAAAGVNINVTLIFTERQYREARNAIWEGARRRKEPDSLKSVYSIFISRIDVYTEQHVPELSGRAQGQVGILNAQRIWRENEQWWSDKQLRLAQDIVFASTGTKKESDPKDKYVEALAGAGIMTNPPETNEAIQKLGKTYTRRVDQLPPEAVQSEIDEKVDLAKLEATLMEEGLKKFADPQRKLLELIEQKRIELAISA